MHRNSEPADAARGETEVEAEDEGGRSGNDDGRWNGGVSSERVVVKR
jgi:hypothetical protein